MPPPNTDALNKEDLYLLLESYKNSVEMNTVISQQLTSILDALKEGKVDLSTSNTDLKSLLKDAAVNCENVKDKMVSHDKESLASHSKIFNKINLLYVGVGSIVIGLLGVIITLVTKYNQIIHLITTHMGTH
jgi:hypothetical protein